MPYIRADVAFLDNHEPNLDVPAFQHVLRPQELGIEDELREALGSALAEFGESSFRLVLWLTNLQREPLAVADNVTVTIRVRWELDAGRGIEESELEIRVAYVSPGQRTAIELGRIQRALGLFEVRVEGIVYDDIFGGRTSDTHGALSMSYDSGKGVRNEREFRRHQRLPADLLED